ncbi:MAG: sulfatase [Abditibacteriales bacterium]|nr:sulfatase [Abditibacteriales bacterium]
MSPQRPNILIVITHDTGRHLGCYGRGVETPHLDRLASEGVMFTQAFCTAPQCSPSRASLLTGRMPHRHGLIGLTHRGFRLTDGVPLLPALLAAAGYDTHLFGFQHEAPDAKELGYQHVHHAEGGHSCLRVTPLVLDFLAHAPQPFLAMVGFAETHRQFPETDAPIEDVKVPPFLPDASEIRRDVAGLNEAVRRVDSSVGEILDALQQHGLADNTLFLYTTDHGIAFPGAKATLFDPGIEIALLARGPSERSIGFQPPSCPQDASAALRGGKVINALVSNADLAPTILELCGVPIPPEMDGTSLLPLARGEVERVHECVFVEQTYHAAYDPMRGVRTERFKYIRSFAQRPWWLPPNVDNGYTKDWYRQHQPEVFQTPRRSELLYDLARDPLERQNVVDNTDYFAALTELRDVLERWMQETHDPLLHGDVLPPTGAKVTPSKVWGPEENVTTDYDPRTDKWP